MSDIKAIVEELAELWNSAASHAADSEAVADKIARSYPSLLAELRRLWAVEETALSLRETDDFFRAWPANKPREGTDGDALFWWGALYKLFAALPPRKPSGGEEAR